MAASDIGGYLPVKFPLDGGSLAQLRERAVNRPAPNAGAFPPAAGALSPGAVDALVDAIPWQVKTKLLAEHEAQWRRRERATVGHMQRQHGAMLAGLHEEIGRLQATCRRLGAAAVWSGSDTSPPSPDHNEAEATRQALADRIEQLTTEGRSKDDAVLALGRKVELQQEHYERELRERNEKVLRCKKDVALKDAYIARLLSQIKNYQSAQAAAAPPPSGRHVSPAPPVGEDRHDEEHGGHPAQEEGEPAVGLRVRGTHVEPSARQQRLRRGMSLGAYTMPRLQHAWGTAASGNTVCTSSSAVSAARHLPRTSTTGSFLPPIIGPQQQQNSTEKTGTQQGQGSFQRAGFRRLSGKLRADAKSGDAFWIRKEQGGE